MQTKAEQLQWQADFRAAAAAVLQARMAHPPADPHKHAAIDLFLKTFSTEIAEEAEVVPHPTPLPSLDTLRGQYLRAALDEAHLERQGDGLIVATVPKLPGVWAGAPTPDECVQELLAAIQTWITVGLEQGHPIPVLGQVDLNPRRVG